MKTCVLFPQTFSYNYLNNGSAARAFERQPANEINLEPRELAVSNNLRQKVRNNLSLVSTSNGINKTRSSKPKLLHIEDSAQIRLLVSIFLKNEFDVESASSGETAIKQIKSDQYDLILVDVNLGNGMDGFKTSRKIREFNEYKNVPIIVLTTNDYDKVKEECISSRINAYIQKPFEKMYLLGAIQEVNKHLTPKNS